jgi:glycosyltransferase involved in cell wall biosynthesis
MGAGMILEAAHQTAKVTRDRVVWHVVTCEYPPKIGGVSDYTFLIARELAKTGDEVHVWSPGTNGHLPEVPGVSVHEELGGFSPRHLWRVGKLLNAFARPRRLLVQWVPHGYGYRSMNIFFCLWLWLRARFKGDEVEIMFHEVWLGFGGSWKKNMAAALHRVMIKLLKQAASRIWIAGERWRPYLLGSRAPVCWLPVPSNVPSNPSPRRIAAIRYHRGAASRYLIGHFGIGNLYVERMLLNFIPSLLEDRSDVVFLLIGKGSHEFARQVCNAHPKLVERICSTGVLSSEEIAAHIGACDLMVQPYPDGVSTRRGATMAVLANGRPLLTTSGHSTEQFWFFCKQIAMAPADDTDALVARAKQLLDSEQERERIALGGRKLYEILFDVSVCAGVLQEIRNPIQMESLSALVAG